MGLIKMEEYGTNNALEQQTQGFSTTSQFDILAQENQIRMETQLSDEQLMTSLIYNTTFRQQFEETVHPFVREEFYDNPEFRKRMFTEENFFGSEYYYKWLGKQEQDFKGPISRYEDIGQQFINQVKNRATKYNEFIDWFQDKVKSGELKSGTKYSRAQLYIKFIDEQLPKPKIEIDSDDPELRKIAEEKKANTLNVPSLDDTDNLTDMTYREMEEELNKDKEKTLENIGKNIMDNEHSMERNEFDKWRMTQGMQAMRSKDPKEWGKLYIKYLNEEYSPNTAEDKLTGIPYTEFQYIANEANRNNPDYQHRRELLEQKIENELFKVEANVETVKRLENGDPLDMVHAYRNVATETREDVDKTYDTQYIKGESEEVKEVLNNIERIYKKAALDFGKIINDEDLNTDQKEKIMQLRESQLYEDIYSATGELHAITTTDAMELLEHLQDPKMSVGYMGMSILAGALIAPKILLLTGTRAWDFGRDAFVYSKTYLKGVGKKGMDSKTAREVAKRITRKQSNEVLAKRAAKKAAKKAALKSKSGGTAKKLYRLARRIESAAVDVATTLGIVIVIGSVAYGTTRLIQDTAAVKKMDKMALEFAKDKNVGAIKVLGYSLFEVSDDNTIAPTQEMQQTMDAKPQLYQDALNLGLTEKHLEDYNITSEKDN